jgi:adenosylmethionine-8-amino-7-oxononanoate aminotransferase
MKPKASVRTTNMAGHPAGHLADAGPRLYRHFIAGCLIRPFGNRIYLMPPYCNTEAEIGVVYDVISRIDVSHEAPGKSAS